MRHITINKQVFTKSLLNIVSGFVIMLLCSQITIPLKPVPITLQTIGVVLIGLLFKPREATISMLSYIAIGAAGLPIFANFSGGTAIVVGPTGGYLFGFVVAAFIISLVQQLNSKHKILLMTLGAGLGTLIILLFGILWLGTFIGFTAAIQVGLLPFILPGIAKALFTALMVKYIKYK